MKNEGSYNVEANIFKNPETPECSYILGLLWADGYIRNSGKSKYVSLEIIKDDALIVYPIFMKTGKWYFDTRKRLNKKPTGRFICSNGRLFDFLKDMAYYAKSTDSPDKILSIIPETLNPYWWRGYFDGDGCFYNKNHASQLSFSSCYEQKWDFVNNLSNNIGITFSIKQRTHKSKSGKISRSSLARTTNKNNVNKFFQYIYNPNLEKFGFSRKYNKSRDFCNTFGNNDFTKI